MNNLIPIERIENRIFLIRGQKVIVDRDLAELYGVETKYLNRQVKRNLERFPEEFMFQLSAKEKVELVTNCHRFETMKHSSVLPYAFTELGVAMLASVLKSKIAIKISIHIIKAFVKLRNFISTHKLLAEKIKILEGGLGKHDIEIQGILNALRQLMEPEVKPKRKIGFLTEGEK